MSHIFMGHPDLSSRNENLQTSLIKPQLSKGIKGLQSPVKGIICWFIDWGNDRVGQVLAPQPRIFMWIPRSHIKKARHSSIYTSEFLAHPYGEMGERQMNVQRFGQLVKCMKQ